MSGAVVYICGIQSAEAMYRRMERQFGVGATRRLIDGTVTGCNRCVGCCTYREHPGFLTRQQRQAHDCVGKGCYYYLPKQVSHASSFSPGGLCTSGITIRKECL